jgi:hypothetical protein
MGIIYLCVEFGVELGVEDVLSSEDSSVKEGAGAMRFKPP